MRRCLQAFSAALLFAFAPAPVPALAGGGSQTRTDPCALATVDEVANALQDEVGPGQNDGIGDCQYRGASGYQSQVQISVDENPDRAGFFDAQAAQGNMQPVEGIGDGALAFDSPAGFTQVMVLKGDILMSVTLSSERVDDRLAAASALASIAVDRLGTEAAMAKMPGLEALVGEWFGDAGDSARGTTDRRLWSIDEAGHWRMTSAPERSGFLAAEGGRWQVASPQERFGGRYEIEDADHFSASGDIEAEFARIADDAMPAGVDPVLLGIWSGIALTGNTPQGPLDPGLVGYWQAEGEQNGLPATFVWRIGDAGYAVLTVISTLEGELRAENGELSVEPDEGESFAATYKVLSPEVFETTDGAGTIRWQRRGTGLIPN